MCLQRNFNACRKPMSRRAFAIEAPFARGRHRDLGFVAAATGALRARHIQIDGASGRAHRSTAARRRRGASRVSSFCLPSAYRRYEVELEELNTAHNCLILLERAMGIEPTTYSLGSCRSTTELRPRAAIECEFGRERGRTIARPARAPQWFRAPAFLAHAPRLLCRPAAPRPSQTERHDETLRPRPCRPSGLPARSCRCCAGTGGPSTTARWRPSTTHSAWSG